MLTTKGADIVELVLEHIQIVFFLEFIKLAQSPFVLLLHLLTVDCGVFVARFFVQSIHHSPMFVDLLLKLRL